MNSICIYVLNSLSTIVTASRSPGQQRHACTSEECQVATVVGKDRLVFYFFHMEYTVRISQREVIQVAKAVLVVQCTIGFAETRHEMTELATSSNGIQIMQFAGSLYCFASLLYLFNSITSKSGNYIHVSVHIELIQYTLLRITDFSILFSFCGRAVRIRFFFFVGSSIARVSLSRSEIS